MCVKSLRCNFQRLGWGLTAAFVLATWPGSTCRAQTRGISTGPAPSWVAPAQWTLPNTSPANQETEAVRYLLYESQANPARKEDFTRMVELMENEAGVQDSGSLTFSFDPSFEELILHRVQIHRAGTTLDRLDVSNIKVIQPERGLDGHLFTGRQSAVLFVEDLRVGDVLEYAYTVRGANPILQGHYSMRFVVQAGVPIERERLRILWPDGKRLQMRQHRTSVAPQEKPAADAKEYTWDFENLKAVAREDATPSGYDPYPSVELTDFEDWAEVVRWALPLYATGASNMPPELADLLAQWRAVPDNEAKARKALEFVQDDLRYTAIELGPDSYRPTQPFETFRLRYGDCKGKAVLLCVLLRRLGFEALPALVNSWARGAVERRLPSPFAFNRVIVRITLDNKTVWVDPTRSHQGGPLGERALSRFGRALVLRPGARALENVELPPLKHIQQEVTSTFNLRAYDVPTSLTVETIYRNSSADEMRESLARTAEKELAKNYVNFYARYYPGIEAAGPLMTTDDRERNVLRVIEAYQIPNLWEPAQRGGRLEATFYAESLQHALTEPDTRVRQMPIQIPYPNRRQQVILVHLPDKDWSIPAQEHQVEDAAFSFHSSRTFSGSMLRLKYDLETKVSEVPAAEAPVYLKKLDEMQELLGETLYRPDHHPKALLAQMNWTMVVLAGFGIAGTVAVCVWVGRLARRSAAEDLPPPPPEASHLQGLGGWLILVGLGICLGSLMRSGQLLRHWQVYFSADVWQACALPVGENYHPWYGPLLIFEMLSNICLVGWNLLVVALFFAKRKLFIKAYILLLLGNAAVVVLDEIVGAGIPAVVQNTSSHEHRALFQAVFGAIVWVSYALKSRRVAVTFVR